MMTCKTSVTLQEFHTEIPSSGLHFPSTFIEFEGFCDKLLTTSHYVSVEVPEKIKKLNESKQKLEKAWSDRQNRLYQTLSLQLFYIDCASVENWLLSQDAFLSSVDVVDLIKKEDLDKEINSQEQKIKLLAALADELIADQHYAFNEINQKKNLVLDRWLHFRDNLVKKRQLKTDASFETTKVTADSDKKRKAESIMMSDRPKMQAAEKVILKSDRIKKQATTEYPLHKAALEGDLEVVKHLIKEGIYVDSQAEKRSFCTALHCAAGSGHCEIIIFLINSNCDIDARDKFGRSAVMWAARSGCKEAVHLLLHFGASVSAPTRQDWTLLHLVSNIGWVDTVHCILHRDDCNVNAVAPCDGRSPLIVAAMRGRDVVVSLLIQGGADVTIRDRWFRRTALHWAVSKSDIKTISVLVKEGSSNQLDIQDGDGDTALHLVHSGIRLKLWKLLLDAGASPNVKNYQGESTLFQRVTYASLYGGNLDEINFFLQQGAFFDSECIYSNIPIMRESILRDVQLCTQSFINKFHRQSLTTLYSIPYFAENLPLIRFLELSNAQVRTVAKFVASDIEKKLFCNIDLVRPMVLQIMCINTLLSRLA